MTQGVPGADNPFDVRRHADLGEGRREPARTRRVSVPLLMDDGQVRTFEVPSALEQPQQFSTAEFARLTRAYGEATALLNPDNRDQ